MNTVGDVIIFLFFGFMCFVLGATLSEDYTLKHLDPHQCVSVCVEQYEKMEH